MCCCIASSRGSGNVLSWHEARQEDQPCTTAAKVTAVVGAVFAAAAVGFVVWGGYDIYASIFSDDGFSVQGAVLCSVGAACGIISSCAFTCLCDNSEPADEPVVPDMIV
ncbi:MAG: hypothetical protein JSR37_03855 [Verrucomicrobia bacterium]|nr:hypothetical protein [Verrucomicrobiota bacterium]MBS0637560.1 hypothetical protein [Verrucomicrobiota bacterium]